MRYTLLSFIFLCPLIAFNQVNIKGVISDQEGQPLPYTNIVSISKPSGTTTDINGAYHLNNLNLNDTVKITNIAYQPLLIPVKILLITDTIFLIEKMLLLDEVVITNFNKFRDKEKIGTLNNKNNFGFQASVNGVGMYIENKRKMPGWLKELVFKTSSEGPCRNDFRLRFIGFDTYTGRPISDLVHENIIIKGKDIKRTNKIDISDYKIIMPPSGVVVYFEPLGTESTLDPNPDCIKTSRTFLRGNMNMRDDLMWFNFKDQSWKRFRSGIQNPTGLQSGLNIGLEVAY